MITDSPVTLSRLIVAVSKATGVSVEEIKGASKVKGISTARQVFSYLARTHNYSYAQIAKVSKKHHTSIMSHVSDATDRLTDRDFMNLLERVDSILLGASSTETLEDALTRVRALREALEIEVSLLRDLEEG